MVRRTNALSLLAAGVLVIFSSGVRAADGPQRSAPVAVGEIAPDFTLADHRGEQRALSAERGTRPVVLVFYRGHW